MGVRVRARVGVGVRVGVKVRVGVRESEKPPASRNVRAGVAGGPEPVNQ